MALAQDDETSHLRHEVVMRFLETGKIDDLKQRAHIEACPQCQNVISVLRLAKKVAGATPAEQGASLSHCEVADAIARLYEKSLSPWNAANFLQYVRESSTGLSVCSEIVAESLEPEEDANLQQYEDISLASIVLSKAPPVTSAFSKVRQKLFPDGQPVLAPRVGFAIAVFIFITIGANFGYDYYQTTYKIKAAANELSENYLVYYEDTPRLAGQYGLTAKSIILSGDKDAPPPVDTKLKLTPDPKKERPYLLHALELTEDALKNGSRSPKAYQIQAQIYMINGQYEKAESVLNEIPIEERDAAILNDFGVLKFHQRKWQAAARYFERAIENNKKFTESYYNLALTLKTMKDFPGALSVINVYLELEKDTSWRNTALNLQQELKNKTAAGR